MNCSKAAIGLLLSALIIGCASHPAYIPPKTGATAEIEFISESDGANYWLMTRKTKMSGYFCSSEDPEVIALLKNKSIIGKYLDGGKNMSSIKTQIPANGEEFILLMNASERKISSVIPTPWTVSIGLTEKYCLVHQGFVPVAGGKYKAVYDDNKNLCEFDFYEIINDRLFEVATKKYPFCYIHDTTNIMKKTAESEYKKNPESYK